MVNVIKAYDEAREGLAKMFGLDDMWHNVITAVDQPWCDYNELHNEVGYGCEELSFGFEPEYSFEVYGTSRWESECGKYTLFVGDDGCGNRDMYLFDNANKVEE